MENLVLNDQAKLEEKCSTSKRAMMINHMRGYLAKRNSTIIWGNGFIFNSDNEELEKFVNKFVRDYRLNEMFFYIEEKLSKYGRCLITLNQTQDGEIKPNLTDNMYLNQVAKSFYSEDLAVVWQRIHHDQSNYWIKSTYDRQKCVNDVYDMENRKIVVFDAAIDILRENRLEKVWNHNLGFVPVVEIPNYPQLEPMFATNNWNECTDWWNAQMFELLYYQAYLDFKKELALCHSRIGLEQIPQQVYQDLEEKLIRQSEMDEQEKAYTLSDIIIETGVGGKATIISGNGDFTKYADAMDSIMDAYCKFANSARFSEGGNAQKSTQEIKTTRSAQVEAINSKILLRETKYSEFFAKILAANKKIAYDDEWNFTFKINGNIQKEETLILDNIIKQVNMGSMSMVEAISKLRNIPLSRAQEIFDEIKEFNEANDIITNTSAVDMEEGGPFDSVGGDGAPTQEGEVQ